jgi:hypothetical protein
MHKGRGWRRTILAFKEAFDHGLSGSLVEVLLLRLRSKHSREFVPAHGNGRSEKAGFDTRWSGKTVGSRMPPAVGKVYL